MRASWRRRLAPLGRRLAEPSTWASLGALALAAGWKLPEGYAAAAAELCGLAGLLLGVFMPERGRAAPPAD